MSHEDAPSSEVVRTYLKNIETRLKCKGQSPNWGQSPHYSLYAAGRAEPCLTSGGEAAAHGAQPPPSPASHRAVKRQRTALNRRALPHIGRRSRSARRSTAEPCLTSGGEAGAHGAQPP